MGKKATIIVDVQNDFVSGALGSQWTQDVEPKIVQYVKSCITDGSRIYATRDTHYIGETEINGEKKTPYKDTLEGKLLPVTHCVFETVGWMNTPDLLDAFEGNVVTLVDKPTFGSYDLVEVLKEDMAKEPINKIELCGFCTSICVLANAVLLRAAFPNIEISVISGLCADVTKEAHEAALTVLKSQQIEVI